MHDVFISYSHKDKTVADAVCARFEAENIRCWYAPRDIAPGADWAASIIDAINSSKVMVLIFTDFSNASKQVLREVNNAVSAGIPIVPFKLTETLPTKGMQYYLATVHWLDAMNLPLEKSIDDLEKLIKAILSGEDSGQYLGAASQGKKKKKWLIPVIAAALVVLIGAGAAIYFLTANSKSGYKDTVTLETEDSIALEVLDSPGSSAFGISDVTNTGTEGNLQCNYQNGGLACTDGTWIFFQGNHRQSLYRMKLDGSEKSKLNDVPSSGIGVVDDYVYYYSSSSSQTGIFRMRPDGTENTTLFSGTATDMMLKDGRIYFKNPLDRLTLYSITYDGSDYRKENSIEELGRYSLWEDRIYWMNTADGNKLYSAKIDGTDEQKLTDESVSYPTVVDGWIIYISGGETEMMNLETKETQMLTSEMLEETTVSPFGVIGLNETSGLKAYRVAPDGLESGSISDVKTQNNAQINGYVFYTDADDDSVYIMKYDGSDPKKV